MRSERRHISLVGPTLLIGLGVILLLNNLGYLSWGLWDVIRLWPILLVAAGLELMFGRRSLAGSLISALLILVLLGGAIWLFDSDQMAAVGTEVVDISYPLETAETAEVTLRPGIAEVEIDALVDSVDLMAGTVYLRRRGTLDESYTAGNRARIELTADDDPANYVGTGRGNRWELGLNPVVETDLLVDTGVGNVSMDLSALNVDDVTVDFGVAQTVVQLPEDGDITIDGGIGSIVVEVPRGAGVRVELDAGLVGRNLPARYDRDGDVYTSPAYGSAEAQMEITLSLGIGSITVREVGD